jgi:hypothetical protein
LDAEYFDATRIDVEERLTASEARPLREACTLWEGRVSDPKTWSRDERGLDFPYVEIAGVDTFDGFVLPERVPLSDASPRARVDLKPGLVALSSVRPSRNHVFVVTEDLADAVGSTGLVVLKTLSDSIGPEVLFALLKTRVAVAQLDRRARASMYPTLHPSDVLDVLLPPLDEQTRQSIRTLVVEAQAVRRAFVEQVAAMQALVEESFAPMEPDVLVAELSSRGRSVRSRGLLGLETGERIDAEYHRDAFQRAHERMANVGVVRPLGQLVTVLAPGRSPSTAKYSEDDSGGPAVLKVGALSGLGINWPLVQFIAPAFIGKMPEVLPGDVLFNSTAHEPGYIAHRADVVGEPPASLADRLTCVADIMRLRVQEPEVTPPHYVAAFLRNALGREQIRRCTCGVRGHVYESHLRDSVVVPIPEPQLAARIAVAATDLEASRWKYRALVREAIQLADAVAEDVLGQATSASASAERVPVNDVLSS